MAQKKNFFQVTKTIGIIVNLGSELYYSHLKNGEKMYHLFHIGFTKREDYPDTKILAIIFPFIYIAFGYNPIK